MDWAFQFTYWESPTFRATWVGLCGFEFICLGSPKRLHWFDFRPSVHILGVSIALQSFSWMSLCGLQSTYWESSDGPSHTSGTKATKVTKVTKRSSTSSAAFCPHTGRQRSADQRCYRRRARKLTRSFPRSLAQLGAPGDC